MPRRLSTTAREPVDHGCPSCGDRSCSSLECLCRPRYFAGQLLTDDDLRRLDHYIVAKNRLHNRYLHGTGVVCGLEVVCNPCDNTVTVRAGYALGPCGEDIVVCHDVAVDIGDLIQSHRRKKAKDCEPFGGRPAQDCEAARQRWVLAICYDERPSRGVTSLRHTEKACCGSHEAKGPSTGHGHGDGNGGACCLSPSGPRTPLAQCEPTVTCEGFRFVLRKEPKARLGRDDKAETGLFGAAGALAGSELGERVRLCLLGIAGRMRDLSQVGSSTAHLVSLCCDLKADLRDIIETGNVHDCMIGARLSDVVCPDPDDDDAKEKATKAIQLLLAIAVDLFKSCVCSALLPPCGDGSPDDCIPLATLTVRTADLRVLDICNWSSRRFAVTFPMLGYWLGWLPIFDTLRASISRLCCAPARQTFKVDDRVRVRPVAVADVRRQSADETATAAAARPAEPATAEPATRKTSKAVGDLATHYARRGTPLSGLEATVLAALGATNERGGELASDVELDNPLAALAVSRLAGPALGDILPDPVTAALARLARSGKDGGDDGDDDDDGGGGGDDDDKGGGDRQRLARLEASIEGLEKTVRAQSRTITALRKQMGGDK